MSFYFQTSRSFLETECMLKCFLIGVLNSEGKNWESQRKFTIKHLREFGIKKQHMENLVSNEVKELISSFKEYLNNNKPMLIKDTFVIPVLNGLWILTAGKKLPQQDTRLAKLHHEFISLVYSLRYLIYVDCFVIRLT